MADPMAAAPAETDSIIEDIPLKALDGTGVNETEVGDEIELDLDALIQSVSAEMPVDPTLVDPMADPWLILWLIQWLIQWQQHQQTPQSPRK